MEVWRRAEIEKWTVVVVVNIAPSVRMAPYNTEQVCAPKSLQSYIQQRETTGEF